MNEEYPLYPKLAEQGKIEAQAIMDSFKLVIKKAIEDIVDEFLVKCYTDVSYYVESDHWSNYRNALMDGFQGYGRGTKNHEYDFKDLRKAIYSKNKEEIVKDLNQDLIKEVKDLKQEISDLQRVASRGFGGDF